MSLLVKICGLSTRETLDVALDSGADMVGFVFFPPSPRHLALERARDLGRVVKGRAIKVALTVDADDATFESIVETLKPDILQIHGKETTARVRDLKILLPGLTRGEGLFEYAFDHYERVREPEPPTRPRRDNNPLNRKEYLLHVVRRV